MPGIGGDFWDYGTTEWAVEISSDPLLANSRVFQSPPICEIANEINDRYDFMPLPDGILGYTHIGTAPPSNALNAFSNTSPFARDVGKTTLLEAQLNYERLRNAANRLYWTGSMRGTNPSALSIHSTAMEDVIKSHPKNWHEVLLGMRDILNGIRYRRDCFLGPILIQDHDIMFNWAADTYIGENFDVTPYVWPITQPITWGPKGAINTWVNFLFPPQPKRQTWSSFLVQAVEPARDPDVAFPDGPPYGGLGGAGVGQWFKSWVGKCSTANLTGTIIGKVWPERQMTIQIRKTHTESQVLPALYADTVLGDTIDAYPGDCTMEQTLVLLKKSQFFQAISLPGSLSRDPYWASANGLILGTGGKDMVVDVDLHDIHAYCASDEYTAGGLEFVEFMLVFETKIQPSGDFWPGAPYVRPGHPTGPLDPFPNYLYAGKSFLATVEVEVTESDREPYAPGFEEGLRFTWSEDEYYMRNRFQIAVAPDD